MKRDGRRAAPIQTDEVTVALDGGFLIDTVLDEATAPIALLMNRREGLRGRNRVPE